VAPGQAFTFGSRNQREGDPVAYYQKVLRPEEKVIFHTTIHWIVYWPAVVFLILAVAAWALSVHFNLTGRAAQACTVAALILALLALVAFLRAFLRRLGTEIVVTDNRVIYKRGLISRHTLEMNASKIETVDVEQSFWGRIFGYGAVVIRGTGGTFEPLVGVASPLQLRNAIMVG
jgi:uncharacterized membrane protein YdbT with pleckstrin-like domain